MEADAVSYNMLFSACSKCFGRIWLLLMLLRTGDCHRVTRRWLFSLALKATKLFEHMMKRKVVPFAA